MKRRQIPRLPAGDFRVIETPFGEGKTSGLRPGRKYEPLNKGGDKGYHGVCPNCDRSFVVRDPHHEDTAMAVPPLHGDVIVCENCDQAMLVMKTIGHEVGVAKMVFNVEAPINDAKNAPPLARCPACGLFTMTKADDGSGRMTCARGHIFGGPPS